VLAVEGIGCLSSIIESPHEFFHPFFPLDSYEPGLPYALQLPTEPFAIIPLPSRYREVKESISHTFTIERKAKELIGHTFYDWGLKLVSIPV
jgi:hypothetical protein